MRPLVAAGILTLAVTMFAAVRGAEPAPTPKLDRARITMTIAFQPAAAGMFVPAAGAGANLGVGGGVLGVAGGGLGQFGLMGGPVPPAGGGKNLAQFGFGGIAVGGGMFGFGGGAIGAMPAAPKTVDATFPLVSGTEKAEIVAHIPAGKALEFQKKWHATAGLTFIPKPVTYAFTGRLTTEDEAKLFAAGKSALPVAGTQLQLEERNRLVFVVESAVPVLKSNKGDFPPEGMVRVDGVPVDAKADLAIKGIDAATLAIKNDPVPVLVPGKSPTDAAAAKKVRATGSLTAVDGVVRLQDTAAIKVLEKK